MAATNIEGQVVCLGCDLTTTVSPDALMVEAPLRESLAQARLIALVDGSGIITGIKAPGPALPDMTEVHGDNGAGLGASHQTRWTGIVAKLMELFGQVDPRRLVAEGRPGAFKRELPSKRESEPVAGD